MTEERKAFNIAENIFSAMCTLMKNLPSRLEYVKNNGSDWLDDPTMCFTYNMSIGFYGMDTAAVKLAEICSVYGVEEMYCFCDEAAELASGIVRVGSLDELFERSKIISVHMPLTEKTRRSIKKEQLRRLRNNGMFINLYDREIQDKGALAEELKDGRIRVALKGWEKTELNNVIFVGDELR